MPMYQGGNKVSAAYANSGEEQCPAVVDGVEVYSCAPEVDPDADAVLRVDMPSPGLTFQMPFVGGFAYDCYLTWGDGTQTDHITSNTDPALDHVYADAGQYDIVISGLCETYRFGANLTSGDRLIDVLKWGKTGWTSMLRMYENCENCVFTAPPASDTSLVTNVRLAFYRCFVGTPDVSEFTFPLVADMSEMWNFCSIADPDFSNWDTSSNTRLDPFIINCANATLNGVGNFDTSQVTHAGAFGNNTAGNPNLENWLIPKLTDMWLALQNTNFTQANYDLFLINCAAQSPNIKNFVDMEVGDTGRTAASDDAVNILDSDPHYWTVVPG